MHNEAWQFITKAVKKVGTPKKIVEFGALNVNGSARTLFPDTEYVGVDPLEGRGVDFVGLAKDFKRKGFDLVVCTETLEHDPDPVATIKAAWKALKAEGYFLITAAAPPRAPHLCDGRPGRSDDEHYANITQDDLTKWLKDWNVIDIEYNQSHGDIYALAQKPAPKKKAGKGSK